MPEGCTLWRERVESLGNITYCGGRRASSRLAHPDDLEYRAHHAEAKRSQLQPPAVDTCRYSGLAWHHRVHAKAAQRDRHSPSDHDAARSRSRPHDDSGQAPRAHAVDRLYPHVCLDRHRRQFCALM